MSLTFIHPSATDLWKRIPERIASRVNISPSFVLFKSDLYQTPNYLLCCTVIYVTVKYMYTVCHSQIPMSCLTPCPPLGLTLIGAQQVHTPTCNVTIFGCSLLLACRYYVPADNMGCYYFPSVVTLYFDNLTGTLTLVAAALLQQLY